MSEPFIGQIFLTGWNFAARGFALTEGQLLPISSNTALFSLLGTTYGGDGRTTLALPDLRGRCPIGFGNGPGLTNRPLGQRSGAETHSLTVNEMPSHNHSVIATNAEGDKGGPGGKVLAAGHGDETIYHDDPPAANARPMAADMIAHTGSNAAHNNMPPFLAMNYQIALVGLFPSRS